MPGPIHQIPIALVLTVTVWLGSLGSSIASESATRPELLSFSIAGSGSRGDVIEGSTSVVAIYGGKPAQIDVRLLMQQGIGPGIILETYASSGPVATPLREPIELVAPGNRPSSVVVTMQVPVLIPSATKRTRQLLVLRDGETSKPIGQVLLLIEPAASSRRLASAIQGLKAATLWGEDKGLTSLVSEAEIELTGSAEDSGIQGIPWASNVTASLSLEFGDRMVVVAVAPSAPTPIVQHLGTKTVVIVPSTSSFGTDPRYEDLLIETVQPQKHHE